MTVTLVTTGAGLTGGPITDTGTISLLPPVGGNIGGVKAGANVLIGPDGTISVAPPNPGTITGVSVGGGLLGGGTTGTVTVAVNFATPADVVAGTVNFKAISPSTLSAKVGSLTTTGFVQLSDDFSFPDSTRAATPTAVKAVYDVANAALPRSGGVMTGPITFAPGQSYDGIVFPVATTLSTGVVQVGPGLSVNGAGLLTTVNNGTVKSITAGPGIGAPASGDIITSTGTLRILPPTSDGLQLGGVKAGDNINIAVDGTISAEGFLLTNNPYAYNSYIFPPTATPAAAPGNNGDILTLLDRVTGEVGWTPVGTIKTVTVGPGLTTTTVNGVVTIGVAQSGVLPPNSPPQTFGATGLIPTLTIDNQGKVISAGEANPYAPFQVATVTAPPDLVLDFADNNTNWEWTMQGNLAMQAPVNAESGQTGMILIRQNTLNPYVLTWHSNWKWDSFTPEPLTPVAAAVDAFLFTVVSPTYIVITKVLHNIG